MESSVVNIIEESKSDPQDRQKDRGGRQEGAEYADVRCHATSAVDAISNASPFPDDTTTLMVCPPIVHEGLLSLTSSFYSWKPDHALRTQYHFRPQTASLDHFNAKPPFFASVVCTRRSLAAWNHACPSLRASTPSTSSLSNEVLKSAYLSRLEILARSDDFSSTCAHNEITDSRSHLLRQISLGPSAPLYQSVPVPRRP